MNRLCNQIQIPSYLASLCSVELANVKLHHLRHFIQKGPEAPGRPPAQHHAPPHAGLAVLHQQDPPLPVRQVVGRRGGRALGPLGSAVLMVPDARAFARQLHVDGLSLAPVGAQVAATVLELLEVSDGVGATGSGYSPHTKRKGHLCEEDI